VDICEYGAIEVISVREGELKGLSIDHEKCEFCKLCIEEDFCFQQLFSRKKNKITGLEQIEFKEGDFHKCFKCLKCFKECPYNAIIPIIV
jgi:ferredoxin